MVIDPLYQHMHWSRQSLPNTPADWTGEIDADYLFSCTSTTPQIRKALVGNGAPAPTLASACQVVGNFHHGPVSCECVCYPQTVYAPTRTRPRTTGSIRKQTRNVKRGGEKSC